MKWVTEIRKQFAGTRFESGRPKRHAFSGIKSESDR